MAKHKYIVKKNKALQQQIFWGKKSHVDLQKEIPLLLQTLMLALQYLRH